MENKLTMPQKWHEDVKMVRRNGRPTQYGVRRHESPNLPGHYRYEVLAPHRASFSDDRNDTADRENFVVIGSDWFTHARLSAINLCRRDHDDQSKRSA